MCGPAFIAFTAELTPMFLRSSYVPALKLVSPFSREYTLNTHDGPITPRCDSSLPMHGTPQPRAICTSTLAPAPPGGLSCHQNQATPIASTHERHDDEAR